MFSLPQVSVKFETKFYTNLVVHL